MKEPVMKVAVALMFVAAMSLAAMASPAQMQNNNNARTFSGVVMDSACAQMGSHKQMEQKENLKASNKLTGKDARECTMKCVQNGSQYVLYDPNNKMTYQLSNQEDAEKYAGEWVRVRGTYDESSKTINVQSISPRRMQHSGDSGSGH